jgi:hypothetical protein
MKFQIVIVRGAICIDRPNCGRPSGSNGGEARPRTRG